MTQDNLQQMRCLGAMYLKTDVYEDALGIVNEKTARRRHDINQTSTSIMYPGASQIQNCNQ